MSELPPFSVRTYPEGSSVRVRVSGELDLATVACLHDALEREQSAGRGVILDLSDVSFMDSSGLRLILRAQGDPRRDGWQMVVDRRLGPEVTRLLELTGAMELLDWHP
jgi:anti-anti-sigma factor